MEAGLDATMGLPPRLLSMVFGKAAGTVRAPGSSWDQPDLCVGCSSAWLCLFSFLCQHHVPKAGGVVTAGRGGKTRNLM